MYTLKIILKYDLLLRVFLKLSIFFFIYLNLKSTMYKEKNKK